MAIYSRQEIKKILSEFGIRPKKEFGQTFLISETIAQRMVEFANIDEKDIALEPGAGLGGLSKFIYITGCKLICVEKDPRMVLFLRNILPEAEVICGDILKIDPARFTKNKLKFVGNPPYAISNELIQYIARHRRKFENIVLSLQVEFIKKLTASHNEKQYGWHSVFMQYLFDIEVGFDVPPSAFYPRPKIWSRVVRFTPKEQEDIDITRFIKALQRIFNFPHREIKNNLGTKIEEISRIDLRKRPVDLPVDEIVILAKKVMRGEL